MSSSVKRQGIQGSEMFVCAENHAACDTDMMVRQANKSLSKNWAALQHGLIEEA